MDDAGLKAAEADAKEAAAILQKAQAVWEVADKALQTATATANAAQQALLTAQKKLFAANAACEALRTGAEANEVDPHADSASREKATIQHIRSVFYRMGFVDQEIVALIGGGHAYGRCHPTSSGYAGPWIEDPTKFSNEYCADLLEDEWAEITSETPNLAVGMCPIKGKRQYNNKRGLGTQMMLVSDMCLLWDPEFRKHLRVYADDPQALSRDFGHAFKKLTELGFPESAKPASEEEVMNAKQDIRAILSKLGFDDGSLGPIFIRLAWHSAGTYDKESGTGGSNGATMRFEPESTDPENAGLKQAKEFLEPIASKYPHLSNSDLWVLASYVAIAESGGPIITFRSGRVDKDISGVIANGRLPSADRRGNLHSEEAKSQVATVKPTEEARVSDKKLILLHLHHHFVDYFSAASAEKSPRPQIENGGIKTNHNQDLSTNDNDSCISNVMTTAQAIVAAAASIPHEDRHQHLFHRHHHDLNSDVNQIDDNEIIAKCQREMLARPEYNHPDITVHVVNHIYRSSKNVDATVNESSLKDVSSLREHLRWAMRLELAAIPPYLYAMYSMKNKDQDSYKALLSIAVEEMLHASLAANLLMSVGGSPSFYDPEAMPLFPIEGLPYCQNLRLTLAPLSESYLSDILLPLEEPSSLTNRKRSASQVMPSKTGNYSTIGDFYSAIEGGFVRLSRSDSNLFENARPELQMKPHNYKIVKMNAAESGGMQVVSDLASARVALECIIHQGEGADDRKYADHEGKELTHYHKLLQVQQNFHAVGEVYPCLENPRTAQFSPLLQVISNAFNASYSLLMLTLNEMYQETDSMLRLHNRMYALMEGCMRPTAQFLCANPYQPGSDKHAGPTFEPYIFPEGSDPLTFVCDLMRQVIDIPAFAADSTVLAKVKKNLPKIR